MVLLLMRLLDRTGDMLLLMMQLMLLLWSLVEVCLLSVVLLWMLLDMLLLAEVLLLIWKALCFVHIVMHCNTPFLLPATASTPSSTLLAFSSHCSHQPPAVGRLRKWTYAWSTSWTGRAFTFWFSGFPASFFWAFVGEELWRVC